MTILSEIQTITKDIQKKQGVNKVLTEEKQSIKDHMLKLRKQ